MAALGLGEPAGFDNERRAVYQDACHMLHAQGIQSEPRALLNQIPNLRLLPIADAGMCCGSAGTYNMDQPAIAAELGRRKVESILAVEPDLVVSGNIGCITQLRQQLATPQESAAGCAHRRIALAGLRWRALSANSLDHGAQAAPLKCLIVIGSCRYYRHTCRRSNPCALES